jgi:hypothetical protein
MLSKVIEKLLSELTDGLVEIEERNLTAEKRLSSSLLLIRTQLKQLRNEVKSRPFITKQEQIYFFKHVKPIFLSKKIGALERYNLAVSKPVGTSEKLIQFYEKELEIIQRFFSQQAFMYQYYRSESSELDELYFLPGAEIPSILVPEFGESDPEFSACGDYLFAKFKAFEILQEFIANELLSIEKPNRGSFSRPGRGKDPLKWTGDQVNVIELGYSIWLSGQINNGDAALADIMYWLSQSLDIDLTRYTRRFDEIKARKLVSQTRFVDQMREGLRAHIDNSYAFQPNGLRRANRIGSGTGK